MAPRSPRSPASRPAASRRPGRRPARDRPAGDPPLLGIHCVEEALRAGRRRFDRLLVRRGARPHECEALEQLARAQGIPVVELEPEAFPGSGEAGSNPQGVALEAGPLPELGLDELFGSVASPRCLVALDGVEDPQNVGAIARVADAAGASGLILTERRAPPLSSALARASAGAIEWLPVARVSNLGRALARLKELGVWVAAADLGPAPSLFEVPDRALEGDLVLVLGAEGRGLRPSIREQVDHPLRIPMTGQVHSLNVATAAAVILFEIRRRSDRR